MPSTWVPGQNAQGFEAVGSPVVFGQTITPSQGIVAGGNAPTVGTLASVGFTGAISSQVGTDMAGSFVLTAGTGAAIAAGTLIAITFARPLPTSPAAVLVTTGDTTASANASPAWGAVSASTTGFYLLGAAPTASHTYLISYQVIRQN